MCHVGFNPAWRVRGSFPEELRPVLRTEGQAVGARFGCRDGAWKEYCRRGNNNCKGPEANWNVAQLRTIRRPEYRLQEEKCHNTGPER